MAVYNWSKALLENDMSSALKVNKGEGKGTAIFLKNYKFGFSGHRVMKHEQLNPFTHHSAFILVFIHLINNLAELKLVDVVEPFLDYIQFQKLPISYLMNEVHIIVNILIKLQSDPPIMPLH